MTLEHLNKVLKYGYGYTSVLEILSQVHAELQTENRGNLQRLLTIQPHRSKLFTRDTLTMQKGDYES